MGLPPTGEIVARVMLARVCGCLQEFQHYKVDKYRAQRQAKFQKTRCPACAAKVVEEQQKTAPMSKVQAFMQLPPGTQVSLTLQADGSWTGTLAAAGTAVEDAGGPENSPQVVLVALARRWLTAQKPRQPPRGGDQRQHGPQLSGRHAERIPRRPFGPALEHW